MSQIGVLFSANLLSFSRQRNENDDDSNDAVDDAAADDDDHEETDSNENADSASDGINLDLPRIPSPPKMQATAWGGMGWWGVAVAYMIF